MTNYKNSGYAVNAGSANIEYAFQNDKYLPGSVSVTLDGFLAENPGATPEDFAEWKRLSDEDYLDEKRGDYNTTRMNLNIEWAEQQGECYDPSPEDKLAAAIDTQEERERLARRRERGLWTIGKLTAIQQRRYKMYHVDGLSTKVPWLIAQPNLHWRGHRQGKGNVNYL